MSGTVGALLGSLLGVVCIIILRQLGYVAAISGVLMAVCPLKGYELLGGKLSNKGIGIACVIMLVMTFVGDRLDWAIVVSRSLGTDFFTSFRAISYLMAEGAIYLALIHIGPCGHFTNPPSTFREMAPAGCKKS